MHDLRGYKRHSRVSSGDIEKPPCQRLHPTHHPAPSEGIGAARSSSGPVATVTHGTQESLPPFIDYMYQGSMNQLAEERTEC